MVRAIVVRILIVLIIAWLSGGLDVPPTQWP